MHWHAERTMQFEIVVGPDERLHLQQFTLRGYAVEDGYAQHLDFDAIAQAVVCRSMAFVFGAKTVGSGLSRSAWKSLGILLRDDHGVEVIVADRNQRRIEWSTARAGPAVHSGLS